MALHPLAEKFASVAEAYERGRPEYAPAVAGAIAAELKIPAGGSILDLAAGTGKLTQALVAAGYDVVAVEPQAEMRERLAAIVGQERVKDGVAEAIPLPDDSVDAVSVADGFHWFDGPRAIAEIGRVLRPGGGIAVLNCLPDWSAASWSAELGSMVEELRPEHPFFDGTPWHDTIREADGWTEPRYVQVIAVQPTDPERIVNHVASMSFVAALDEAERGEFMQRITTLLEAGETPGEVPVNVGIGLSSLT